MKYLPLLSLIVLLGCGPNSRPLFGPSPELIAWNQHYDQAKIDFTLDISDALAGRYEIFEKTGGRLPPDVGWLNDNNPKDGGNFERSMKLFSLISCSYIETNTIYAAGPTKIGKVPTREIENCSRYGDPEGDK
jgi:hypothetical protein